jgi:hypothetical protein
MNIFFDVDITLLGTDDTLRPGSVEFIQELRLLGHSIYLWSSGGKKYAENFAHRFCLCDLISGCFDKFGTNEISQDYIIDDDRDFVEIFESGYTISPYINEGWNLCNEEFNTILKEVGYGK